ncbi:MAG: NADH-quinone oxidoreductase subunit H [Deltaproteobacteria bacterium]|nr:NADH-quinone oxidoreductase subunit H [Deltaproteobacteria bacterium]
MMSVQYLADAAYREEVLLFFSRVIPGQVIEAITLFATVAVFFSLMVTPIAAISVYIERRLSAKMQSRIGCNRLGPEGIFQMVADGIKMISKEDFMPQGADAFLFKFAPYLVMVGAFVSFACIPFSKQLLLADINIGVVYLLALSSIVVIGIMLAGWSSNNKWSLLGSLRSAAQIVSYEIPLGMSLLIPVIITGSLNLQEINQFQSGGIHNWLVFYALPFTVPAFVIYFISALAEVNRTPFDLPEAESELVSGFHTEYSGIRWGLFFIGEYHNMFLISCIAVTAFLGGYQKSAANFPFVIVSLFFMFFITFHILTFLPKLGFSLFQGKNILDMLMFHHPKPMRRWLRIVCLILAVVVSILFYINHAHSNMIQVVTFISKAYFLVLFIMWLRWSLPRYRIDQLMDLCWKKLIPISFICLCGVLVWVVLI